MRRIRKIRRESQLELKKEPFKTKNFRIAMITAIVIGFIILILDLLAVLLEIQVNLLPLFDMMKSSIPFGTG